MSKATLMDCCIKKYAYKEISQIYKEIGVSPDECGVCNPIDNAILACQTMPGHEQHFADLLIQHHNESCILGDQATKK